MQVNFKTWPMYFENKWFKLECFHLMDEFNLPKIILKTVCQSLKRYGERFALIVSLYCVIHSLMAFKVHLFMLLCGDCQEFWKRNGTITYSV